MLDFPERWLELHLTQERIERCRTNIARWMKDQNRAEVAERAQKLGVALVPVNTVEDVLESAQMQHRRYFAELEHPTLGRTEISDGAVSIERDTGAAGNSRPLVGTTH